ncbi:uncharacterized protein LOC126738126 [Anthonomus grandis grandis]|uniref:uncharacterized protein LOC126738126 n=1 Tax=Anthonomus grandis grandis TaxID=2921223 RepID=UPI002165D020|nr:uncharacterized protein LOC126738126 [Anthonomus grandis grandis]
MPKRPCAPLFAFVGLSSAFDAVTAEIGDLLNAVFNRGAGDRNYVYKQDTSISIVHKRLTYLVTSEIWFQQDAAPPHFAIAVRQFLAATFSNKWWPPDVTSLYVFNRDI